MTTGGDLSLSSVGFITRTWDAGSDQNNDKQSHFAIYQEEKWNVFSFSNTALSTDISITLET